jgi:hypothetical protein
MLKHILPALAAVALSASSVAAQTAAPGVSLTIRDGKVTLKAEQVSLRQILAEWERQGQVKVVGADKLLGAPVTLNLIDVPEKQALEIVMRGVPGYMAVDRVAQADAAPAGPSRYDRVVVMARAATPVPAVASAAPRGMPSPAQPPAAFQQTMPDAGQQAFMPPPADEGAVAAGPERNDVEQFQQVEPPMPDAPVASPYPNAYPGSPYVGASINNSGPYGGNPAAAEAAGVNVNGPPETQFDYANPQKYFEQRRLQQQGQQPPTAVPSAVPTIGTPIGTTGRAPSPVPTNVPTAPGVLPQPGVAPVPRAAPTPAQGEFFNPYNLPADWVPPPAVPDNNGTPVEPDRAKYSNPYNPSQPPE